MIHFIQHGLLDKHSHFYGETLGFVQAAQVLKRDLQVWVHAKCEPQIVETLGAQAVFPLQTDAKLDEDPVSAELTTFMLGATTFGGALSKHLSATICADDWVYVAYASQNEAYGLALWMQTLPLEKRPRLVLFCHRPELRWAVDAQRNKVSANASFWRFSALMFEKIGAKDRVQVFAPGSYLSDILRWASGLKVHTTGLCTPYFITPAQALATEKHFDIGLMGEFRPERGSDLMADLMVALDRQRPGMRYVLQLNNPESKDAMQQRLAGQGFKGRLRVIPDNRLEPAEFARLIAHVRLMVLPYHPDRYRMRSSGVLSECIAYGVPCVVPDGTWLGDQVQGGHSAGLVFGEWTTQAIYAATLQALEQLEDLAAVANKKMLPWRQQNCARAMLERLV
jgi:glycosyltransferase involved in cell wall biosynthesis